MTRILVVTVDEPWGCRNGGQLRVARLTSELARHFDTSLVYCKPDSSLDSSRAKVDPQVQQFRLAQPRWGPLQVRRLQPVPWLGVHAIAGRGNELLRLVNTNDFDVIYWSHSYLPAAVPKSKQLASRFNVVEFPNVEQDRYRSVARGSRGFRRVVRQLEFIKSMRWEPNVAKHASIAVALSIPDVLTISRYARQTLLVPNGTSEHTYVPSSGPLKILAVGSWDYAPNLIGMREFLVHVWPEILRKAPKATLRVVGRDSHRVEQVRSSIGSRSVDIGGFVDSLQSEYAAATVVLAPANQGGGQQLKVTEALSYGRVTVGPAYLDASPFAVDPLFPPVQSGVDVASLTLDLLFNVSFRHLCEQSAMTWSRQSSWEAVSQPLVEQISEWGAG